MRKGTKVLLLGDENRYLINYRKEKFHTKDGAIDLSKIEDMKPLEVTSILSDWL